MGRFVRSLRLPASAAGLLGIALLATTPVSAYEYPTYERVRFSVDCMTRNGGNQALLYQCACAIDKIAAQYSIDDFVNMQTSINAVSVTGERGSEFRDSPEVRAAAKRYRETESAALRSCGVSAN